MDHLAIPVRDVERSRRFYETYFGFGASPARRNGYIVEAAWEPRR
jgi:catechol 2,3-dioxygenase-like lactoylglutathione lyase family enzyme